MSPGRDSVVRPNKNRPVLAAYIYQDQRFKGQDEFLGGNVAGGPAGRRCLRKTNDFRRITATRRERISRIYQLRGNRDAFKYRIDTFLQSSRRVDRSTVETGIPIRSEK